MTALPPPPGYHGRYLRIDVSAKTSEYVPIAADVLRRYLGGSGLGTWLLLQLNQAANEALAAAVDALRAKPVR